MSRIERWTSVPEATAIESVQNDLMVIRQYAESSVVLQILYKCTLTHIFLARNVLFTLKRLAG